MARGEIIKQKLIEMSKEYSDEEWEEAIFSIPSMTDEQLYQLPKG